MKTKILSTLFVILLTGPIANAQIVISTQHATGGDSDDRLSCVAYTLDGSLEGGFSASGVSGEKTAACYGSYDYWIVKRNKKGIIQWDKTFGGSDIDQLISLAGTRDSGYILAGVSASGISGDKTDSSRGGTDYWIIRINKNGKILWQKTFGGASDDECRSVQQTRDGGYILGGHSRSGRSMEKSGENRGASDYWIIKLDALGAIEWDKTIGGTGFDGLSCLQQTSDGGYILGGKSNSNISAEKSENSRGGYDYWIVKTDSLGNIQWNRTIGGNLDDNFKWLQQTADKGYILGGFSASNASGEKTQNSKGGYDYWIVKTDSIGRIEWDKTLGGSGMEQFGSLQQTMDGGYITGGYSNSGITGDKTENNKGGDDYWIVKLDRKGNVQWDKTIGGNLNDDLSAVKEIKRNQYVVAGYSSSGISGDRTDDSRGLADYWTLVLHFFKSKISSFGSSTNDAVIKKPEADFIVYPNPARMILHVSPSGTAKIMIYNAEGKLFITKMVTGQAEIDISNLCPGIYFVRNNVSGSVKKIVVY